MAKKVKKKAKAIKAWAVLVGPNKDKLSPAFLWKTRKSVEAWTGQFTDKRYPNIAPVLIIEDTPANRKRLGVKRGK